MYRLRPEVWIQGFRDEASGISFAVDSVQLTLPLQAGTSCVRVSGEPGLLGSGSRPAGRAHVP